MQRARYLFALSCVYASAACGTEIARAVNPAPPDGGIPGLPDKPPRCSTEKLIDRLSESKIALPEPVRYKRALYFFGLPQDDRIAFSMANNNLGMVAWVNAGGTTVYVTHLAVGPDTISRIVDLPIEGTELSGLVALDDGGFALLTRRPDIGDPLGEGPTQAQATYLVRWQNGREIFAVPLTGTVSIVDAPEDVKRDYPNPVGSINALSGRLAHYGSQFGAYFSVRGGLGDRYATPQTTTHADKFVQVDKDGQFVSGWRMGCRQSLGNRLVADASGFTAFCMSDGTLDTPGLRLVLGVGISRRIAGESRDAAYAGGNFGSAVKVPDGYLVAWASRGVSGASNSNEDPVPAFNFHEPAVAVLDNDRNRVLSQFPFLPDSQPAPIRDAVNVHAANYGDKVLIVWETIDSPQFRANGYSTGAYGGTHFQLVDAQGKKASEEETRLDFIAPNGQDEIVQFPNGDLGWAYVPEVRNFQTLVPATDLPNLPAIAEIRFVRLKYCVP